jgi:DNA-binding XRE family transcriptional regulator
MTTTEKALQNGVRNAEWISPLGASVEDDLAADLRDPAYRRANIRYALSEALARAVIRFRMKRNLTMRQAAAELGLSVREVAEIEKGERHPSLRMIVHIAERTETMLQVSFEPLPAAKT